MSTTKRARVRNGSTSNRIKIPACDSCHSRKIKCSKNRPCENCIRYKTTCIDSTNELEGLHIATSTSTNSDDVDVLRQRITDLERLLEESNPRNIHNGTKDASLSTGVRFDDSCSTTSGQDLNVHTRLVARAGTIDNYAGCTPTYIKEADFPSITLPNKPDATIYYHIFMDSRAVLSRVAQYPNLKDIFDNIYGNIVSTSEQPVVAATIENLHLSLILCLGMYPNSLLSTNHYQKIKSTLRARWSELTLENLTLIIAEITYLGFVGRLDEAWLALGVVCRNAHSLGFHREDSTAFKGLDSRKKEIARNTWWEIYVLDRWYSCCTGRPCLIRDKDCEVQLPNFTDSCDLPPWQPAFFTHSVRLSRIMGKVIKRCCRAIEEKDEIYNSINPFKPRPEQVGSRLHEELNEFRKNLPPSLQKPANNLGALILAFKFQGAKSLLFRHFVQHDNKLLRIQAQEEVLSCAIVVTQICGDAQDQLKKLPCGTMSMVLLTSAVALASYSRACQGQETAKAIEAKVALEDLCRSIKTMHQEPPSGVNRLARKNHLVLQKLRDFGGSALLAPSPSTIPQKRNAERQAHIVSPKHVVQNGVSLNSPIQDSAIFHPSSAQYSNVRNEGIGPLSNRSGYGSFSNTSTSSTPPPLPSSNLPLPMSERSGSFPPPLSDRSTSFPSSNSTLASSMTPSGPNTPVHAPMPIPISTIPHFQQRSSPSTPTFIATQIPSLSPRDFHYRAPHPTFSSNNNATNDPNTSLACSGQSNQILTNFNAYPGPVSETAGGIGNGMHSMNTMSGINTLEGALGAFPSDMWANFDPDLEFGGVVDPFNETFLSQVSATNGLSVDDWTRLLR